MKIFVLLGNNDDYGFFDYAEDEEAPDVDDFNGQSLVDKWVPPRFVVSSLIPKSKIKNIKFADAIGPGFNDPIWSKKAVNCLWPFIKGFGEFLPTETEVGEYYFFNVTKVIDALDRKKSEFTYFPDGIERNVKKFTFKNDKIKGTPIFKIPYYVNRYVFVNEKFKKRVEDCGLEGFIFNEVWDSEKD